ncbi:WbqC-like protein family protein [Burkholderia sp. YR290]|nr:WbqC-like protein family protein [Burkholderia sp. YR290]
MKVAIMQPYLLPYIGYFQLINAVDLFVVYDNIKYTKSGWFNRNRFLLNGSDAYFTVPLQKDSDSLDVVQRQIAPTFDQSKFVNQLSEAYRKAPHYEQGVSLLKASLLSGESNLFKFIKHSIQSVATRLGIPTPIVESSSIDIDHGLKSQDKVLAICRALGATEYVNAIGGIDLYSADAFRECGLELRFIKSRPIEYVQFKQAFVPWLSIVDVVMFNEIDRVRSMLDRYEMISGKTAAEA